MTTSKTIMKPYHDVLADVLANGIQTPNRTGIDTLMIPGAMMKFDLRLGFPAITTKYLNFGAVVAELVGFLRGATSAATFRELGTKIWDANANMNEAWLDNEYRKGEDDLGRIYGAQWRKWTTPEGWYFDQVTSIVTKLFTNPTDRRMIISAWNPGELDRMALPPCHVLYQFIANKNNNTLHLCLYQRSCDMFLGVPFNIASASLMLSIMAKLTGFTSATFTHFLADAHIYVNHIPQVKEQLSREHNAAPSLWYSQDFFDIAEATCAVGKLGNVQAIETLATAVFDEGLKPHMFSLDHYVHHPAIKAEMAL